ncbi:DUF2808 domain-containing protein [Nostoc sp. CHAB 5715]|uniref:DUF2808 domain-containing protein n=1 Tax=Nostoc sp. CHAB 5715 TaxID=2780400 RepID=UPI001E43870D|nr:DUF2808 domain-containing protein [Nostoc sp. CHAB 5715]MCC5620849.1 DUF2808 domain-containing protein [Nostoc sp. CHAB 5715]
MKKVLVYVAISTLAAALLIPANYASANEEDGNVPHVDGNYQFPQTRWMPVRHTLRVHVPKNSKSVSQLKIEVPSTVKWSNNTNDVVINENNDREINTNVSVNGKTILLAFAEPIVPNTKLKIDIKNVKQPFLGNGPVYRLSANLVGINAEIPIGVARFRVNL